MSLFDIPYIFYWIIGIFVFEKFPKISQTLMSKIYGIKKDVTYPKYFDTFIFNWGFSLKSHTSNKKPNDQKLATLRLVRLLDLSKVFKILKEGGSVSKTLLLDKRFYYLYFSNISIKRFNSNLSYFYNTFFVDGFLYIKGLLILCIIDALIADDEPLCEPVEWSLIQSWILFIFLFAWIGENLISSRYGSYTGRDKRVWFSWYKTLWLIEGWYVLSMGMAALWVMVPHYYEVTYNVSFIQTWWNWYSRVFFLKFISLFTLILFLSHYLLISIRWNNWKHSFYIILLINFFLGYLLYTQFFMSFFGYFTDPRWHAKTRIVDYVQLSHEPSRWGWGDIKRDHFTYHRSKTVFWFKNDGPFASAFLFFNMMFFLSLFSLSFFWITLTRRVYITKEITYTYTTYCVSSLKQFFYFFTLLFVFIFLSFFFIYWRTPNEFLWTLNPTWSLSEIYLESISILRDYWSWFFPELFLTEFLILSKNNNFTNNISFFLIDFFDLYFEYLITYLPLYLNNNVVYVFELTKVLLNFLV